MNKITRELFTRLKIYNKQNHEWFPDELWQKHINKVVATNTLKTSKICAYPSKFVSGRVLLSGVQCNEMSRHVRGSSCHLWWTWRWDGESWGPAPSSTRGSHPPPRPPRWCFRTGSRRRAPCVAKFQTLRYDLYTELRQHDI